MQLITNKVGFVVYSERNLMIDNWHSYSGNMHIHTRYSDGEKLHAEIAQDAITAGLDFIIITDHNTYVTGVEGYYKNRECWGQSATADPMLMPRRTSGRIKTDESKTCSNSKPEVNESAIGIEHIRKLFCKVNRKTTKRAIC